MKKITEKRVKQIIQEELARADAKQKNEAVLVRLQTVALQAAMLHDGINENIEISSWAAKKLNSLAEDIDDVFYHFQRQNSDFFKKSDS